MALGEPGAPVKDPVEIEEGDLAASDLWAPPVAYATLTDATVACTVALWSLLEREDKLTGLVELLAAIGAVCTAAIVLYMVFWYKPA
jgi:hypothetical protein